MKKLMVSLVCIGLLSNSLSAISPLRVYKCRPSNPSADCSQEEKDSAKNWFKNAKIGALTTLGAVLAALGIAVSIYQLQKEQVAAVTPVSSQWERVPIVERSRPAITPTRPALAAGEDIPVGEKIKAQVKEMDRQQKEEKARIATMKSKVGEIDQQLKSPNLTADERATLVRERKQLITDMYAGH